MKKIFYNGTILTLEDNLYEEAILIEDGIIKKLGSKGEILKLKDDSTELIDLNGHTLMPGFIDSHSHIGQFASILCFANITGVKNYDELINKLIDYKKNVGENDWIIGYAYEHNFMEEKMHPTKAILDQVSLTNPIIVVHQSGHMGVANSKALELLNITSDSIDPIGGKIGRIEGTNEPNGYLEETAFMGNLKMDQLLSPEVVFKSFEKAQNIYLQNGITTAQDGLSNEQSFNLLKALSNMNGLKLDVVSYIDIKNAKEVLKQNREYLKYHNHYKIGGYKIILDGSPQAKTAWLSKPYEGEETYQGYPVYSDEEVKKYIKMALDENMQILAHTNGDAASEQLIRAFEELGYKNNYRPVMIHAQTVRQDQLPRMNKLNMIASFYVAHVYHFGDIHIKNLGERAKKISPIHSAIQNNVVYTMHQDTPVITPNMLETIWCSVKRITKNGVLLDDEKISVLEALKGVTINAAYQYFEEDKKGTLKEGKLADMIILDQNPLEVFIDEIKNIKVLETIKEGNSVYSI